MVKKYQGSTIPGVSQASGGLVSHAYGNEKGEDIEVGADKAGAALPPNASLGDIARARAKSKEEQNIKAQGELTSKELEGLKDHNDKTFNSVGSADVGGGSGMGQKYHDLAMSIMREGDPAYDANQAAMRGSIANMKADRGQMSPENATLLGREAQSRADQMASVDLNRQAAMGGAPSAANYQTQGAMDASMGAQAGAMGSSRSLAGLGGSQVMGAQGTGMQASQAAMSGGMGRSKEMSDAMGLYGSSASGVRAGDLSRLAEGDSNSLQNAQLNNAWKISQGQLGAKQGALGIAQDAQRGKWFDAASEPAAKQAAFDQENAAMMSGVSMGDAKAQRAAAEADRNQKRQLVGGATTGVLTAAGGFFGGPVGAIGGGMAGSAINEATKDLY